MIHFMTHSLRRYIAAGDWPLPSLRRPLGGGDDGVDDDDDDAGNGNGNSTSSGPSTAGAKTDYSMSRAECVVEAVRLDYGVIADSVCRQDDCAPKG